MSQESSRSSQKYVIKCDKCSKNITRNCLKEGKVVLSHGKIYHENHLTCTFCQVLLRNESYKYEKSGPSCLDCYMTLKHPKCTICLGTLYENTVLLQNQLCHKSCVKCNKCNNIIKGTKFYSMDGKIFDEDCYIMLKLNLLPIKQQTPEDTAA